MIDAIKNSFKKYNINHEFLLTIYLVLNVVWIFFALVLYYYTKTFQYKSISTSYIILFAFNFLYISFLFLFKKIKFNKIDIFLILLFIFGMISVIFAHDSGVALYGFKHRYEGFFQLLYYYSVFFLSTSIYEKKYKEVIIDSILVFGLLNTFICIIQVLDIFKFIPILIRGTNLGQGLITNSNFYGSYVVLCLCLSIGMFIYNSDKSCWMYLVFSIIFYSGLLMSNALSGMIGFIFSIIFIIALFIKYRKDIIKLNIIKFIVLAISLVGISILLVISNKTFMFKDIIRFSGETTEMAKGNFNDTYGSSRMFVWKNTLKVVPKHFLHGIGIDNFCYAFGDLPLYSGSTYYDKAHNEYLQKLMCEGVFSCITYIGMLFMVFVDALKNIFYKKNYIIISLFLGFVAYCVQAFFNISVIEVAPIFWIVCGLLYDRRDCYV